MSWFSHYYHLCIILFGSSLIGLIAGALGTFVYLRKQSLVGDAISHATLPGIVLALLITANKNPTLLLLGGAISGTIGIISALLITRITKLQSDTVLGIILSLFFGTGLLLLSIVQKYPRADQAVLNKFLFGNIAILLPSDVWPLLIVGLLAGSTLFIFWKELKVYSFDQEFSNGIPHLNTTINILLTALLVMVITICLQCVGVILMSSLLIAPTAAARQWTVRLETTTVLAAFFGAVSAVIGTLISNSIHTPTGPTIVLVISTLISASLILSPRRGLLMYWFKRV